MERERRTGASREGGGGQGEEREGGGMAREIPHKHKKEREGGGGAEGGTLALLVSLDLLVSLLEYKSRRFSVLEEI
jgi:hypothetical protein